MAYVVNEHRYFLTSGSTTATWSPRIYCKVASVRVVSSAITYFKPNLQLNLAQKIEQLKVQLESRDAIIAERDKEMETLKAQIEQLKAKDAKSKAN